LIKLQINYRLQVNTEIVEICNVWIVVETTLSHYL